MIIDRIELEIQNMGADVIDKYLDKNEVSKIKEVDPHPLFQVYGIAHKGISKTNVIGLRGRLLNWFKDSIIALHDKIAIGTKVFIDHLKDSNTHFGRTVVGRVVGKFLDNVGDMVQSYAIVYREPAYREIKTDVASYEGKLTLPENALSLRQWNVSPADVGEVTGIALGDSTKNQTPAFPGATLQVAIQNMAETEENMDINEIKKFIKETRLSPVQLFTVEEILDTPEVDKKVKDNNASMFYKGKRYEEELIEAKAQIKKFEAEMAKKDETIAEKDKEIAGRQSEIVKYTATDTWKQTLAGRNLSPNRAKWLEKNFSRFQPTGDMKKVSKEIDAFMDSQLDEFETLVKEGLTVDDKEVKKTDTKTDKTPAKEPVKTDQNEPKKVFTRDEGFLGMLPMDEETSIGLKELYGQPQ